MISIDIIISIVVTAIVIGVPFYYGARKAIVKAVNAAKKSHQSQAQQFVAGVNALIKYYEQHPTQDKELLSLLQTIAKIAGVALPSVLSG